MFLSRPTGSGTSRTARSLSSVTVWGTSSSLVHVTVVPGATVSSSGSKAKSAIATAAPSPPAGSVASVELGASSVVVVLSTTGSSSPMCLPHLPHAD